MEKGGLRRDEEHAGVGELPRDREGKHRLFSGNTWLMGKQVEGRQDIGGDGLIGEQGQERVQPKYLHLKKGEEEFFFDEAEAGFE